MIDINHISKSFGAIKAVDDVSLTIKEGNVFGLIGTNGAGKSTVLRMITGVLKPDGGDITIDTLPVYENPAAKASFFFIADTPYYFANATPEDMKRYYQSIFPGFDSAQFDIWLKNFELEPGRKINTFSKGMKKQLSLLLGICSKTKYLFCDETFDGLDPVMRQGIKSLFAREIEDRKMTPVVASHNLRELEDICDHVGLLHKGGVLLSKDLDDMKYNIQKIQCVFTSADDEQKALAGLSVIKSERRGSLRTLTVRGQKADIMNLFANLSTVFFEILPLTLEEIFISETEVAGYDIKKLILN